MKTAEPRRRRRGRGVGLSVLLLSLPLLVLLPLLLYSGVLLYLMGAQAREATQRELVASDAAVSAALERELRHAQETLRLLAESPALSLQGVDQALLARTISEVAHANSGLQTISVVDAEGWVLQEYPGGLAGARRITLGPQHRTALEANQLVITDLHVSRFDGRLSVTMNYPVWRVGRIPWLISARLSPQYLSDVLSAQLAGREGAVATVLDTQRRMVARTSELDRFFGMEPSPETLQALQAGPAGVRRFATLDGNEHLWAWSTLSLGWTVLVGIPARAADTALHQSLLRLASGGLVAMALGLLASALLARHLALAVGRMAADAPRLTRGEDPAYRPSGVRQIDALRAALRAAGSQVVQAMAERDHALEAERQARAIADEDNRAKDVFIATLSHELRNPLSPIRAAAAVLQSPRADEARRAAATDVIARQAAAMGRLLEDLLDVARINNGRIVLERRVVPLAEVLESAIEVARPLLEQRRHALQLSLPTEPVLLDADPLRLGQVFANLLTNAAKYTDPGGRIAVDAQVEPGQVVVHVRDNGIGLEPQALEQVFQKFAQVRGELDRSQGGLGIGLSLVRGLVRLHGGWVRARSEGPGKGSEFSVGLPLPTGAQSRQSKQPR